MSIKLTLTFNDETMETLRRKAKDEGFELPSRLARYLLVRALKDDMPANIDDGCRIVSVHQVENCRELELYVKAKRLGNLEIFAAFAMQQYMTRYPLKTAPEGQNVKVTGN